MICSGLIKDNCLFSGVNAWVAKLFRSKKIAISLIAALSGILPIPGRNVASAPILDSVAAKNAKSRSKYGIISYLATHHWYLWSPLEKSVIIITSALGLTFVQVLSFTWPLLLIMLAVLAAYLIFFVKNEDIEINLDNNGMEWTIIPFLLGVGLLICGIVPWLIFGILAIFYIFLTKTFDIKKLLSYIRWDLVAFCSFILIISDILNKYNNVYVEHIKVLADTNFVLVSIIAFLAAFLMGSSSKYAGIVAILVGIYGIGYLPYFLALEFAGYLISPMHKCVIVSKMYFGTSIKHFLAIIITLCILLISCGIFLLP